MFGRGKLKRGFKENTKKRRVLSASMSFQMQKTSSKTGKNSFFEKKSLFLKNALAFSGDPVII